MKPGDVITCGNSHCGAQARATTTAGARWQEGWPVILPWPDGRNEVTAHRPDRCLSCHERFEALGMDTPPPRPPGPMREIEARSAGEGPLNVGNPPTPPADGSDGNKAPLERSAPRGQLSLLDLA